MFNYSAEVDPEFGKWGCTLLKRLKTKKRRRKEGSSYSITVYQNLEYTLSPFIVSQINYTVS